MKRGRGVVMQAAADDHVIVMTSQGEFVRVPFTKPVCIGQEIFYTIKRPPILWKWSIVAALLLAIVSSASQIQKIPGGLVPTYYITLDINPSIELGINAKQRVVSAEGLNQAGVQLLNKMKLTGYSLKQALKDIEEQAELDGYLKAGENEIVVTFSQDDIEDCKQLMLDDIVLEKNLASKNSLDQVIGDVIKETLATVYHVQVWKVPTDVRKQVREAGMTPANYIAVHVDFNHKVGGNKDSSKTAPVTATIERDGYFYELGLEITRPIFDPVKTMHNNSKE
ncbi:MAG: anti-sigma factor domain-containing protein [Firmicutes bacterium]|nr:anti-sigma factor domain-containing protein [Bacillota bacterium]